MTQQTSFYYDKEIDMYVPSHIKSYMALDMFNNRHFFKLDDNGEPVFTQTEAFMMTDVKPTVDDYHTKYCTFQNGRWELTKYS